MARKAYNERRKAIAESLSKMLLHYLQNKIFPGMDHKALSERTGITQSVLSVPWWQDIPEICEGAGLDLGITVRDAKGHEVTFWPSENFSEGYRLPKTARKPLPPVERVTYFPPREPLNHAIVHHHGATIQRFGGPAGKGELANVEPGLPKHLLLGESGED